MEPRESRVLNKLRSGELVSCLNVKFGDGQVAEIAAMSGFDCVWTDLEHSAQDWSVIQKQIWATKISNVDLMVRTPRGSSSDYNKPLELDAAGILVPHIMGLKDAQEVIQMARFPPEGRRSINGSNADDASTNFIFSDYLKSANEHRFLALQIEDPEPLEELESIASLQGFDMLFFGPTDFSQGIGIPGDLEHQKVSETRKLVAEIANKHGKFAATSGYIENLQEFVNMGYNFINIGADFIGFSHYCHNLIRRFRKVRK